MAISGAVTQWNEQYLAEINGQIPKPGKVMTPKQQEIQLLNNNK